MRLFEQRPMRISSSCRSGSRAKTDGSRQPAQAVHPSLAQAGRHCGERIGWHNFCHSLATNPRAMGVDVKVAQELLRRANVRTTLDIYARAVSQQRRDANAKVVEMMLPGARKCFSTLDGCGGSRVVSVNSWY